MRSHTVAALLAGACFAAPLLSQDPTTAKRQFLFDYLVAGERTTAIRYGNWFGPGWWGGSEDPQRAGPCLPIDPLDAVAQKHDFGYAVAEKYGIARPDLRDRYKAMADGIAVRDAKSLPDNPLDWTPPPKNPALARRYRDRIVVGFAAYVQPFDAMLEKMPHRIVDVGDPDVLDKVLVPAPVLDEAKLEALANAMVRDWNADAARRVALAGTRRICGMEPPAVPRTPVGTVVKVPVTGAWVLEKTEFDVEKVDAAFMASRHPSESGADGSGSVQATFGHPDPKVNTVTVRMQATWTSPPTVMIPGREIPFRMVVTDAGSDDPKGLYVGGTAGLGVNIPSLSHVWYGPAAGYELRTGPRSKEASKSYTPPDAQAGAVMSFEAAYSVGARRQRYIYVYKFVKNVKTATSGERISVGPPLGVTPAATPAPTPAPTPPPAVAPAGVALVPSGNYSIETTNGSGVWVGTLHLTVSGTQVSGTSEWDCCPGHRIDPLTGTIVGNRIRFTRECSGQGFGAPCSQVYEGVIEDKKAKGTFTMNGAHFGSWSFRIP